MTLEDAAKVFVGPHASASKIKTKVRRLYDISNVFLALNIIEKTMIDTRKPAYVWKGLQGFLEIQSTLKHSPNVEKSTELKNVQQMATPPKKRTFDQTIRSMFKEFTPDRLNVTKGGAVYDRIPLFVYKDVESESDTQMM